MSLEEKVDYLLRYKDIRGLGVSEFLDLFDTEDKKLSGLYIQSKHYFHCYELDNPKILLVELLYKILKDKE